MTVGELKKCLSYLPDHLEVLVEAYSTITGGTSHYTMKDGVLHDTDEQTVVVRINRLKRSL